MTLVSIAPSPFRSACIVIPCFIASGSSTIDPEHSAHTGAPPPDAQLFPLLPIGDRGPCRLAISAVQKEDIVSGTTDEKV